MKTKKKTDEERDKEILDQLEKEKYGLPTSGLAGWFQSILALSVGMAVLNEFKKQLK